ncbi:hypothetical protein B0H66DRAFT_185456 [Apodospora peruviana]|uniref:Uncharacterized protein n=1 Tax=Apodospora peruviana TaxID=516989 RepID=A0AAE0IC43_9PEZI|nr:hypothetical protein B0H66DRAFT_185456 [Apodospora peruviana]
MFLGLSKWWWQHGKPFSAEFSRLRGTLDMEPLVALIGMRLPTYKGPRDPRLVLSVLNELLHLPESDPLADWKKEGVFWNRTATVGSVLDRCYERHILQQPDEDDNMAHSMQQILVVEALRLISIWEGYAFLQKPNEPSRDIRNTRLSKLFSWGQIVGGWIEKFKSTEQTFRSSELSLPTLQRAGNIQITWTQYLDKHLEFDVDSSTLRVFWFGFMIQAAPFFHIWCKKYKPQCGWAGHGPGSWPVGDELLETYSLLFRSPSDIYIANLAEYGKMPIPEWVRVLYGDETGVLSEHAAPTMSYLTRRPRPWLSDMEFHAQSLANRIPVIQRFDSYPIFGDQLRMLKAYMDAQKPGGIVGLWRDNRDSMAWYTFWAVVFVGSLSLVLSFLSLIVSIAQTYSSFQSLYASQSEREL